jgi:regulator of cell morphogenesis and NO signaling
MHPKNESKTTVSEMVRQDYRVADVFRRWGIDYCCGGNTPFVEVCRTQSLSVDLIRDDIQKATHTTNISNHLRFEEWPVDFLVDYITNVHHAYLRQQVPALFEQVNSFIQGHKKKYPYLEKVLEVFEALKDEVLEHTQKEEETIFPYFKQISYTYARRESYGALFVRTLSKPFDHIENVEHRRISALLVALRKASDNYTCAEDVCPNHRVIYLKLKEFDHDIQQHKYLESNILFPKVRVMEKELLQL